MARPKKPIDLHLANGNVRRLTKAEIEERKSTEVKAPSDRIAPPSYLSAAQKKEFKQIAEQLTDIGLMTNLDCDSLSAYIIAKTNFVEFSKMARKLMRAAAEVACTEPKKEEAQKKKKQNDAKNADIIEQAEKLLTGADEDMEEPAENGDDGEKSGMKALSKLERIAALQDKAFKQCRAAAGDLGLTITSRCRLVVPKKEDPPLNKFDRFVNLG